MSLEIDTEEYKGVALSVALRGRLDSDTAPQLDERLTAAVPLDSLILDLGELDFISSAGLRVLFKAKKLVEQDGGKFHMVNLQPQVQKVFEIVKALPTLSVFRSWAEMDEYLEEMQQQAREP